MLILPAVEIALTCPVQRFWTLYPELSLRSPIADAVVVTVSFAALKSVLQTEAIDHTN